ncbi:MAG: virulence RhuM family protein [Melioribacteraceae bacterium]
MNTFQDNSSNFILYTSNSGDIKVNVFLENETIWLSQKSIGELFGKSKSTISEHLKNIFIEGELDEKLVVRKFRTTTQHGAVQEKTQTKETNFYNLDVIISVGYRVNSKQATQFRIWATKTLKEFIIKGFVLDDERLKQGNQVFGKDYFDELLEKIREIRASERRFYQKITDIYAQCSIDYIANSETTITFYKTVQNKLHWAITGNTASEIVVNRSGAEKDNMGLTTWKNSPKGKILKSDVSIAKNYLSEKEVSELNRLVELYLNFAELQAERNIPMKMIEWIEVLDGFLKVNRYDILTNAGKISHQKALEKSAKEYENFRVIQDHKYLSDFDKKIKGIKK